MLFIESLYAEVISNLKNDFTDNYDYVLLGDEPRITQKLSFKDKVKNYLHQKDYRNIKETIPYLRLCLSVEQYFSFLYDKLENEESKNLLIKIIAYRILGYKKVKLPLNNKKYWEMLGKIETLADKTQSINPHFMHFILYHYDLKTIGYDIKMFYNALGILIEFVIKQYDLEQKEKKISVKEEDVVLDCGACWGDTALFFADKVGAKGKVYSIEFIPSNLDILRKNLSLNPALERIVSIIEHPLHSESGIDLYYKDNGPASMVQSLPFDVNNDTVKTITIDDIVKKYDIHKVDFIKMDIEGAELNALKGAIQTIKTFKPILAIALYHREIDFYNIPLFIEQLNLGYKFYINHNTIHQGETILFAQV
jgi:FkbM family methyltransferase